MAPNGDKNTPTTDDNISLTEVNLVDFTLSSAHGCVCLLQAIKFLIVELCQPSVACTQIRTKPYSTNVVLLIH